MVDISIYQYSKLIVYLLSEICSQGYHYQVKYQHNIGWSECCCLHTTHQHNSAQKTVHKSKDNIMTDTAIY